MKNEKMGEEALGCWFRALLICYDSLYPLDGFCFTQFSARLETSCQSRTRVKVAALLRRSSLLKVDQKAGPAAGV